MVPLATPVIIQGDLGATGLIVALAISAAVVDTVMVASGASAYARRLAVDH